MRPSLSVSLVVLAAVNSLWLGGCERTTEFDPVPEVRITAISPTSLTGTVGAEVQPAPSVRVTDEQDRPLAGVAVTFKVVSGGGGISGGTVTTAEDGSATVQTWTLGSTAGTQTLAASTGGEAEVVFTALATAGPVAKLTASGGSNQLAGVGQVVEQPLVALAADAFGNPVEGIPVVFTVIAGGGTIAGGPVVTDATGSATAGQWTLGAEAGVQYATAVSGSAQAVFRAYAVDHPPGGLQGQLAFVSYSEGFGPGRIAVVNADGSGFTDFAHSWSEASPAWSPDGSLIAASTFNFSDETGGIAVMTADGANVSWLTNHGLDPAWSPDGAAIVFSDEDDFGNRYLTSVSTVDGSFTWTADGPGDERHPAWSPDGRKLVFVNDPNGIRELYTANADGSAATPLTQGYAGPGQPLRHSSHPAWSPDGNMIAFVYGDVVAGQDTPLRIAVMTSDGVFLKDLASAGTAASGFNVPDGASLAWSPDGTGIAFSFVGCDGQCIGGSVKYVSLDGSLQATIETNALSPTWRR